MLVGPSWYPPDDTCGLLEVFFFWFGLRKCCFSLHKGAVSGPADGLLPSAGALRLTCCTGTTPGIPSPLLPLSQETHQTFSAIMEELHSLSRFCELPYCLLTGQVCIPDVLHCDDYVMPSVYEKKKKHLIQHSVTVGFLLQITKCIYVM